MLHYMQLHAALLGMLLALAPQESAPADGPDFVRDIRPILQAHCIKCHGPQKAKGQLRLDSRASAVRGGASGKVIVPGKSQESPLVALLLDADPDQRMPKDAPPLAA